MTPQQLTERNRAMIATVAPIMRQRVENILARLQDAGFRPRIQEAYRTPGEQKALFYQGRSRLRMGFHNAHMQGKPASLAVDIYDDDAPMNPSVSYMLQLANAARMEGCETGILWGLTEGLRARVENLIHHQLFDQEAKVGWDPLHVQPGGGFTVSAMLAGADPWMVDAKPYTPRLMPAHRVERLDVGAPMVIAAGSGGSHHAAHQVVSPGGGSVSGLEPPASTREDRNIGLEALAPGRS